jgi:hypothetical protein
MEESFGLFLGERVKAVFWFAPCNDISDRHKNIILIFFSQDIYDTFPSHFLEIVIGDCRVLKCLNYY